ncbi:hypothetical protein A5657_02975 [Mycobacterium kubicae]|nr:hypothetical protein A5657_02975 [Mycobacterium kubicae]
MGQFVVKFSSAQDAGAFFATSAQRWPACSNRSYTSIGDGNDRLTYAGPVSNANGILTVTLSDPADVGYDCHRALTVAEMIAIDVVTCSYDHPGAAVDIAGQIAIKVAAGHR